MKKLRWNLGVLILGIGYKIRGEVPQKTYKAPQITKGKGYIKKRIAQRIEFVRKHKALFNQAYKEGTKHKDYKTKSGVKIVELARSEIGYQYNTYSGDIFYGLMIVFSELNNK